MTWADKSSTGFNEDGAIVQIAFRMGLKDDYFFHLCERKKKSIFVPPENRERNAQTIPLSTSGVILSVQTDVLTP
ncbi:hypothetical protein CEXT_788401 [Caerostris extrusa]|uniref:Uncharacterized protein n=1 Tax=Caerostris extrusa TaxID=172846 RepID=A0AAV4WXP1_CAEEX|nr:hypothetical protein CEXT_788401 [Caerostris extrusa]